MKFKKTILPVLGLIVVFILVFQWFKPAPSPAIKLPNPNGYDDLVKAGQMFIGELPDCYWSQMDGECLEETRAYLNANSEALKLVRLGLSRESRIPIDNSRAFSGKYLPELAAFKRLAQTLTAEGKVAEKENEIDDAIQSYLDAARLNEKMRGGLVLDALVGVAVEALGVNALQKLSDKMTRDQRQRVVKKLVELYLNRNSFEEIMANEKRYVRDASGLGEKLSYFVMYRKMRRAEQRFETKIKFQRASLGLFLINLSAKNFELDQGRPPKTLQELVPEYLPFLPKDDFSGKDFVYRPLTNGHQLYGVGPDQKDDGGKPFVRSGMTGDMLPDSQ